jgi:hypothetical protein
MIKLEALHQVVLVTETILRRKSPPGCLQLGEELGRD